MLASYLTFEPSGRGKEEEEGEKKGRGGRGKEEEEGRRWRGERWGRKEEGVSREKRRR